jgi:hypothetical protein
MEVDIVDANGVILQTEKQKKGASDVVYILDLTLLRRENPFPPDAQLRVSIRMGSSPL